MFNRRSPHLLILLVLVPLALLAWLGTSLHQEAERRAEVTRNTVLQERLRTADLLLNTRLKMSVLRLNSLAEQMLADAGTAPEVSASDAWVAHSSIGLADQPLHSSSESAHQLISSLRPQILAAIPQDATFSQTAPLFERLTVIDGWVLSRLTEDNPVTKTISGLLIKQTDSKQPELIHWTLHNNGDFTAFGLKPEFLTHWLESSLTSSQVNQRGILNLQTAHEELLQTWGDFRSVKMNSKTQELTSELPFAGWKLNYSPDQEEFPSSVLFPILLGVLSGSLLVPSLGWLYFRESNRELLEAHQRVSFVNQVSHELKTPLTNIRLYAEMVRTRAEANKDEAAVRQLTVVESETARLGRLIQNVLIFARQQKNKLTVSPRPVDLNEILSRIVTHWTPVLEKKKIKLQLINPLAPTITTDPDALEQIIGNLISNAEKYAADGQWVGIKVKQFSEDGPVSIAVEDRGPGIPNSKASTIFEPFERLRSDLREGVSGTGLGLTISRELATLLGGSLSVHPAQPTGAIFVLDLPLVSETQSEASPTRTLPSFNLRPILKPT